jgi:hypothetical protein
MTGFKKFGRLDHVRQMHCSQRCFQRLCGALALDGIELRAGGDAKRRRSGDAPRCKKSSAAATARGAPPRSALTTPASYYSGGAVFLYVETLTSLNRRYGVLATVPCIQSGVFKRGMRLVFRYEILDTSTGKRVTDRDGAITKVRLQHGEEVPARWAVRGSVNALPDSAWMWDASWDIPLNYPVGSFDYSISVTMKDGRTATFTPPIQKTPTSDSRVRIID